MKKENEPTNNNKPMVYDALLCGVIDSIIEEKKVDSCLKLFPQCQFGDVCILCDTMTNNKPKNCIRTNAT